MLTSVALPGISHTPLCGYRLVLCPLFNVDCDATAIPLCSRFLLDLCTLKVRLLDLGWGCLLYTIVWDRLTLKVPGSVWWVCYFWAIDCINSSVLCMG